MRALDLVDWPADRTLAISGRAGSLRLAFTLRNSSARSVSVAEASLANVRLAATGAPLRVEPVPVGLVVAAGGATGARIRLRLDRSTPPGRYLGEVKFAGFTRPVEIEVVQEIDLAIRPAPLVVDAALGARQRLAVSFENRGNAPLTIDLTGRYPLGLEAPVGGERLEPSADGVDRLSRIVDQMLGLAPRPALIEVGGVDLSMPGGPARLEPGATLTTDVEIALPEGLAPVARHHVFAPVYAADLHIVIVTAAKQLAPARRVRRSKGAEG
jgi:hypothetical protein